jgi:hypothetical protein
MADFTLDTSGEVPARHIDPETGADRRFGTFSAWRWSDLTPFQQGKLEGLFASLRGDLTPEIAKALEGIAAYDRTARSRPLLRDRHKALRERCHWSRTHNWPSICDMMRELGLLTVVGQVDGGKISEPTDLGRAVLPFLLGFDRLHPETLAAILKDCEERQSDQPGLGNKSRDGHRFWIDRQEGMACTASGRLYAPLTPYLDDEGKVRTREVV